MTRARPSLAACLLLGLTLCILGAGSLLLWQRLENDRQTRAQEALTLHAQNLARQLEGHLADLADNLQRLAERWNNEGRLRQRDWQREAQRLIERDGYQTIEWLDAAQRPRWRVPAQTVEIPDPQASAGAQGAREQGAPHFSDRFTLPGGAPGMALYVPLYDRNTPGPGFDGYLRGTFRLDSLLERWLLRLGEWRFSVTPLDDGALPPDEARVQRVVLNVPGGTTLDLLLRPTENILRRLDTPWPKVVLGASLFICLLLVAALYLALENHRRAAALLAGNRRLRAEAERRRRTAARLRESRAQQRLILELTDFSRDGLFILDLGTQTFLYMNRAIHLSLGYDREGFDALFRRDPELLMPGYRQWLEEVRQLHREGAPRLLQRELRCQDGTLRPAEISTQLVERDGREFLIGVSRDNTERLRMEARLQRLSQQDGLTGLHNRRFFDQQLQAEWRRVRRLGTPLSLLLADIDHFKRYNDTLGHLAGDDALRQVARLLHDCLQREGDVACRYGGEEFAIILANTRREGAEHLAARIHRRLAELALPHPGSPLGRLTLSIGIATSDLERQDDPRRLVACCDQALYRAKHTGRNRSCVWCPHDGHQHSPSTPPAQ
ncbi:MAG TPA: diguanylate cyclase [Pseudomonas sp.]|nr:diguanylate cyclase [Pseudomonas sp.]